MSRVVKEYDERFAEFLDVAQALFYGQGYEQTSVQQIINAVGVAKGTFYHYFASKAELLDALVRRLTDQSLTVLEPVLADDSLSALEKLERFFAQGGSWKAAHRDLVIDVLRVLHQDENALLRTKLQTETAARVAPLMARIIRQGVAEGAFDVRYPEETAEIVICLGQALSEAVVRPLLAAEAQGSLGTVTDEIERKRHAYNRSVERVLGAPAGSLNLVALEDLRVWLPGG